MDALKKNLFLGVNILLLLATLAIFFIYVAGRSSEMEDAITGLERDQKALVSLSRQKPTDKWYEILDANMDSLKEQLGEVLEGPRRADERIHQFYNLDDRSSLTTEPPSQTRYPEFKEVMVMKWDLLKSEFTGEKSSNGLAEDVLMALEPKWLRSELPPSGPAEVLDSMKRYWIVVDLLESLDRLDLKKLSILSLGELQKSDAYTYKNAPFWGIRPIALGGVIDLEKTESLMKIFESSPLSYRVKGIELRNVIDAPHGVTSDAKFLSFQKPQWQEFQIWLDHLDYASEGESFDAVAVQQDRGDRRSNARRGRRP